MERFILLAIAIFLFASITKAQITKGSTFIGGQISGSTYKYESSSTEQKQKSFLVSPGIGTAINQNLIAGFDITYAHSKNEYSSTSTNEYNSFGGGFFLRRYRSIAQHFYFFLQGRAGYYHDNLKSVSGNSQSSNQSNNFNLGLFPGISYALTKSLHIEVGLNNLAILNYSYGKVTQDGLPDQKSNGLNFSTSASGTNLSFALRFIIPKK